MTSFEPKFFDRVAGAFTAATIAFLPGFFLVIFKTNNFSGNVHPLSWLDETSSAVGFYLAILLAAVFLVAYPVERWLAKPSQSAWQIGGTYALFFGILGLLLAIASLLLGDFSYTVIAMFGAPIAAITAFFGRAIYSYTTKFKATNRIVAVVLALLIAFPLALPDFSKMSYQASDFYPDTFDGEISRGTWDVNEIDNSAGSHFSETGLKPAKGIEYLVHWDCEKPNNQEYRIYVQDASEYKFSQETDVKCSVDHEPTLKVGIDISNQNIRVMISPNDNPADTEHSDAYAVLAPAK